MKKLAEVTISIFAILVLSLALTKHAQSQIVVIDAGHGYNADGSNGDSRTATEINTNWSVSIKLRDQIQNNNIPWTVHLTRPNNGAGSQVSLNARSAMSNNWNADRLLSIHCNATNPPGLGNGTETFWCDQYNDQPSVSNVDEAMAREVQARMVQYGVWFNRNISEDNPYLPFHLGILNYTIAPACLNEIGFVDNASNAAKLLDNAWRDNFANAYYVALQNHLGTSCALTSITPTIVSPGTTTSPGPIISNTTPTLTWNAVAGATNYGVFVRDIASNTLVIDNACATAGTSYTVPSGILSNNRQYRWNMQANVSCGSCVSLFPSPFYFQTPAACSSPSSIVIGQTINGSLQSGDCTYTDGSYYDAYTFNGTAGQQIYVTLNSTQFNAYLLLYQGSYPAGTLTAQDDNGGGGTNARIPATSGFLTLPATGAYTILANSLAAGETGGYSLTLGTNSGGTIPITVQTNPAGRSFTVDGTTYTSAQNFNWTSGTSHTIATTSPQNIAPGARYSWENWNGGGGAISQTVSPTSATTYTANFALTYQLTTNSNPSNGGITTPVSGNWYSSPQNVQISAVPNSGYTFSGWTGSGNGSYSGTNNPASITINGPITETANFTQIPPGRKPFDYDGDGRSDLSVRRQTDNTWYLLRGTAGYMSMTFGVDGDLMVPADYDGDAKTDVAMFRPSTGQWFIFNIGSQTFQTYSWGASSDLPIPADHDGDGKAELVVFRPSTNTWYTRFSNGTFASTVFGVAGDKPVVGDFDGDGKADIGLYRPSDHNWYILKTGFGFFVQTWGVNGDIPVPADYDGDGKTDVAVFRPSTGQWFRIRSTAGFDTVNWGANGDKPIPADYDGDGKADVAVFRPSNATWYIVGSTSGQLIQNYGVAGDLPTQGAFIY